jgi:hypothetical protein
MRSILARKFTLQNVGIPERCASARRDTHRPLESPISANLEIEKGDRDDPMGARKYDVQIRSRSIIARLRGDLWSEQDSLTGSEIS